MQSKLLRTKTRITTLSLLLSLFFVSVQQIIAQTTVDLSLFQKVNTTRPVVGQEVTYTTTVKNFSSSTNVSSVEVQVKLPVGSLEYVSVSPSTASFSVSTSTGIGQWTIPTIAANDSVTLTFTARVLTQGVHYVISEISSSSNPDPDSTPLNNRLGEDDLAVTCVTVPLTFNTGDVFVVGIDPAFASSGPITWLKDNQPITASTTGASVDADGVLTIRSIGEYTFVTTVGACPAGGCCPISVVLGDCTDFITVTSAKSTICVGETATLIGTATNGSSINWYLTPTGGSPIATTASGANLNVSPTTTTVYYAEFVNKPAECASTRQAFAVTVNAIPSTPSCPPALDICTGERVNLLQSILNPVSTVGGVFEWRVGILPTSALVTNPTSVGAGTYYLFETSTAGCVSNPAILVVTEKSCVSTIDLSLTKTADKTIANVNDVITYTVTLRNDGETAATNIEIEDILPAQIQFVSSSQFTVLSASRLRANVSSLGVGQTVILTYVARAVSVGSPINFVQVTRADQRDSDSTPNNGPTIREDDDAAFLVTVVQQPVGTADLSLTKTVNISNPALNTAVTYLITVRNDGPNDATGVFVRDILPNGLVFIGSLGASSIELSGQQIDFGLGTISAGTERTIQLLVGVGATGVLTNYAEVLRVDQNDPDSTPGNQSTTEDDDDTVSISVGGGTTCNVGQLLISCSNPFICPGQSTTLTASGSCSGTITWSNGQTGATISVTPSATITYTASCVVSPTCIGPVSNAITVVVSNPLAPTVQANRTILCDPADAAILTATNCAGIITWSNGQLGSSIQVSPQITTSYTATCKVGGCESGISNTVTITRGVRPNAPTIASAKTTACANENITLTATNCTGTVNWSTGQTGASITVSSTTTRTYTATCTVGSCISVASNAVTITITEPFPITIASTVDELCSGTTATLTANGCTGGTISWSTGQTGASIQVSPTVTTIYTATCTVGVCTSSASKQLIVKPTPTAPIIQAAKNTLCVGETVVLSATNCAGVVTWSTGEIGNTLSVSPAVPTTYSATCAVDGCVSPASTSLTLTPIRPIVEIVSPKPTICIGETTTLVASGCDGVLQWNTGETTGSISVSPTITTTYSVSCAISGCIAETSAVIQVTPLVPAPIITSSKENVCSGESITLTATNCAGTITWSTGEIGASIQVSPTVTTAYTATCTVSGCTNAAQKVITIQPLPSPPLVTCGSERICAGDEVVFTANNCAGTVTWSTGFVGNIMVVNPTVTTAYSATCTINGCTSPASTPVTIQILTPSPRIVASSEVICGADSVTLTATNCAGTIRWSTGSLDVSIRVKPDVTTSYTLSCTIEGCTGTDTKQILVATGTPPVITATSTTLCSGSSVTLSATSCAGEVVWSDGQTGNLITVSPTINTTYTAQCRATNNCTSATSNPITVSVTSQPTAPTLNISNVTVCSGDQVNLIASGCDGLITWSTGETGASIVVQPTTSTVISATCKVGACESAASNATITIGVPAAPIITASSTVVCSGSSVTLTATNCAGTVRWSGGQTGVSIVVSPTSPTSYTAICATTTCQSGPSNSVSVTIGGAIARPSVRDISNICPATTANLTTAVTSAPSSPNGSFVYLTGAQPNSPAVSSVTSVGAGTYFIFERATTGCLSEGSRVVVAIDECTITTDTAKADIAVTISASNVSPSVGDSLIYTIRLTNNGPGVAQIIDLLTTVPVGSATVIGLDGLTLTGNDLSARILNLPKDSSRVFRFQVVHLAQMPVVQEVSVALVSQTDPILSNNRASVTVSCSTCSVVSLGSALGVIDTTRVGDDCVDVTYQALLKNRGTVLLTNIGLVDSLQKSFRLPATFTVVKAPTLNVGSNLVINAGFNGASDARLLVPTGSLAVGVTDTIRYTVRVCPGNLTDFLTQTIATATGSLSSGATQSLQVLSNVGFNPDATGTNPTPLTITDVVNPPVNTACIGLALSAQTERLPNNISVITYKAIIKNCGIDSLSSVQLCDTLSTTFRTAVASILQKPSVNAGSQLRTDTTFNGFDKTCMLLPSSTLAPGKVDTVTWKVQIVENGSTGPFVNNVLVTARNVLGELVQDLSNDGIDPSPTGSIPTVVNLATLPNALIGLAKELGEVNKLDSAGMRFSINFNFYLKNYGTTEIRNVQLEDNLAEVFGDGVLIEQATITADNGLTANTAFTGKGDLINLLVDSTSVLPGQSTRIVRMTVTIDRGTLNQSIFSNTALVSGNVGSTIVDDVSTEGVNPDPDLDGDPRNNSTPTQFDLGEPSLPQFETRLGIAKQAALNPIRNVDGSFDVTYSVVVKNYGIVPMRVVQLADDLVATFGNATNFNLFVKPLVRSGSTLVVNPAFDGINDTNLLLADSSSLAPNASDTLRFIVKVRNFTTSNVTYRNLVVGAAIADTLVLTDLSFPGLDPDPDGDGNPGNNNLATP
ncbi:MAG: hypothetical protein ACK4UP_02890, partial [Spirosomataceae bacterium]